MTIALLIIGAATLAVASMGVYELRRANRELRAVYNKLYAIENILKPNPRTYPEKTTIPVGRRNPLED